MAKVAPGSKNVKPKAPKRLSPTDWKSNTATFKEAGRVWAAHREKRPLDLANERSAKSNNPATWREWQDAARFYERTQGSPVAGVGVMLYGQAFNGKGLVCLDFDDALDESGLLHPWAKPLVEPFIGLTYIERSLGGRGVHVFVLGRWPEGCTKRQATISFACAEAPKAKLEAFSEPHFIALSGDVLFDSMALGEAKDALLGVLEDSGALLKLLGPGPAAPQSAGAVDPAELPRAISALSSIDPDVDRQTWLEVGMALHQAFGTAGWEAWSEWSSGGAKYAGPSDCGAVWASFEQTTGGVSLGTLYHHAKEAGWKPEPPPRVSAVEDFKDFVSEEPDEDADEEDPYKIGSMKEWTACGLHFTKVGSGKNQTWAPSEGETNLGLYLENHPSWRGKLRYNERTMEVEFGEHGEGFNATEAMRHAHFFCDWKKSPTAAKLALVSKEIAMKRPYDPVADWLTGLTWDGVSRLDGLCAALGLEDDHYTKRSLKRWMIGAVARAMQPGCEMQTMLVLHGGQGKKKSSLFKRLAVRHEWYSESHVDMSSKDGQLQLLGPWIVEVAELNGMSKADVEKVKGFISESRSKFRAPYEAKSMSYPRRVVLAGTTNESEFLRDGTGARRFWLIAVLEEIKLDYLTEEVLPQLWAEARVAYEAGERWWDEGAEVSEASDRNEQHYQGTGLDALVAATLANVKTAGTTSDAVLLSLVRDTKVSPSTRRTDVAVAMKRCGWEPVRIRPVGWKGPQHTIFKRPGVAMPHESEEARSALILAFKAAEPKSEFDEVPEAEGGK
jgi:predicted P-loop ATPase